MRSGIFFRNCSVGSMILFVLGALTPCHLHADPDHGPGTTGGGLSTQSGETLRPGSLSLSFRLDYTQFEHLSSSDIQRKTSQVGGHHRHFDALRWSLLETFELAYGITDDFQMGFSFGYYRGDDLREGHIHEDGSYEFHEHGDVSGMTDQWITGKYRLFKGPDGHFSVLGGVKLPFGDDDEVGEGGNGNAPLDAALQPGSGAFDAMLGVAYSRWLTERMTLDTSLQYTLRTEDDDFKIGDLITFGTAVAYRLTEKVDTFPQVSVFLEANVRHLFPNEEDGEKVHNSGGTALFLSPGVRVGISKNASISLAVQVPVIQELHDEQQETDFKVVAGVSFGF
jgi:hypothetical protein